MLHLTILIANEQFIYFSSHRYSWIKIKIGRNIRLRNCGRTNTYVEMKTQFPRMLNQSIWMCNCVYIGKCWWKSNIYHVIVGKIVSEISSINELSCLDRNVTYRDFTIQNRSELQTIRTVTVWELRIILASRIFLSILFVSNQFNSFSKSSPFVVDLGQIEQLVWVFVVEGNPMHLMVQARTSINASKQCISIFTLWHHSLQQITTCVYVIVSILYLCRVLMVWCSFFPHRKHQEYINNLDSAVAKFDCWRTAFSWIVAYRLYEIMSWGYWMIKTVSVGHPIEEDIHMVLRNCPKYLFSIMNMRFHIR